MTRPRIGVNCDVVNDGAPDEKLCLNWSYADAVLRAGGRPVLLAPVDDQGLVAEQLDGLDGLLLTGGRDYDPAFYGQEPHPKTRLLPPRRVAYDLALATAALGRGMPTLGVCGGAQLVNIALGGTLIQHIPSQVPGAVRHARAPGGRTLHTVNVEADSRLAGIVGPGELETNSSHHQAIDEAAAGLRIVARASDGVVEAAEGTGEPFLLAVQWHPERLLERPRHAALFRALVDAARQQG